MFRKKPRRAEPVTRRQFRRMTREQQQRFLDGPGTSMRVARNAGVASRCSSCGEPFMIGQSTDGHRCNPAHLAEVLRKPRSR